MPLENDCTMTYADTEISTMAYENMKKNVEVKDVPKNCRYDDIMQDFYCYITGTKTNPFTYEHDYMVQKVLSEIVGGIHTNNVVQDTFRNVKNT